MNDADKKAFEDWWPIKPHRNKYDSAHPVTLAAQEAWQACCEWRDSQVLRTTEDDPCPACRPNTVCRTPSCGRLKGKRQEPIAPPAAQTNQQLVRALELAETEMRYAGWGTPVADNSGLANAYEAVVAALAATQMRGDA